ncbi:MAG: lipoprotein [Pseudomonadota bacterium]|nr:lipoprotein [Pseudomonadota bacterium]
MRPVLWLVVFAPLMLVACGQKGALYLPETTSTPVSTQNQPEGASE